MCGMASISQPPKAHEQFLRGQLAESHHADSTAFPITYLLDAVNLY